MHLAAGFHLCVTDLSGSGGLCPKMSSEGEALSSLNGQFAISCAMGPFAFRADHLSHSFK